MAKAPERADGSPWNSEPELKHPDPKKHQLISFAKSAVRIISSVGGVMAVFSSVELAVVIVAVGYGLAEVVGIYEELV